MELVYLWIEDYKNIKRQGFTFSPRFKCEFKPQYDENDNLIAEKSELIIEEKKDYINIFPDNINVTAIVGKNGAGKSSVFEILKYQNYTFLILYDTKKNFFYIDKKNNIKIILKNVSKKIENKNLSNVFFSHSSDILDISLFFNSNNSIYNVSDILTKDNFEYFSPLHKQMLLVTNGITFNFRNFYKSVNSLLLKYFLTNKIKNYFFNPNIFYLDNYDVTYIIYRLSNILSYYSDITNELLKINENNIFYNELKENKKIDYVIYLYCFLKQFKIDNEINDDIFLYSLKNKILPEFNYLQRKCSSLKEIINKILIVYNSKDKKIEIDLMKKILNDNLLQDIFSELISIELIDTKYNKNYIDLSSGEKNFLLILSIIFDALDKFNLFLLDELENFIHPNLIKNLINEILKLLHNKKNFYHLILSTHSPFILSDIPKENIIFMKDGKNVSNEVDIETFGANIHTLLTHGFFMEDGLMGEYAKSQIDEVIKYLNHDDSKIKSDDEAQKLINIIGEPIIRKQLQRMLDSKRLNKIDKIDKIDELEKEIELLKARIEILRKKS
ncbi:conserved hypothetical protein [Nautilia profundicola AmH]|uniref:ATPase AAA-type core domain-containing protein n=1 Tax=Nautilia profundicola (strain ATCC BAA-1463 / DSM 18972 / AmH) TaxID=598659 RepID=B9L998_NAUPA|nr:ATP-binding protein [Nautilia profundicola]ACM92924.1 conserved hypothetical protein [Nautilia profundicola AmH]